MATSGPSNLAEFVNAAVYGVLELVIATVVLSIILSILIAHTIVIAFVAHGAWSLFRRVVATFHLPSSLS